MTRSSSRQLTLAVGLLVGFTQAEVRASAASPRNKAAIRVSADGRGFVVGERDEPFVPWGFNYDHDEKSRLIEDYWEAEWPKIEEDFAEMKELGANVVRIHLQVVKFLRGPNEPDPAALDRLGKLLALAERVGLTLDLTGLACYRKKEVPAWYDALDEAGRWSAQEVFWKAVAGRGRGSRAVFCYDLMNEPVVPGGARKPGEWLGPPFGEFSFVQFITLDQKGRPRPEVAKRWAEQLAKAVRQADPDHLVTIGLVDWSLKRPGLTSGFEPDAVAPALDFLCVHLYPNGGKIDAALGVLEGFAAGAGGKPIVIEETFPLRCGLDEHAAFLDRSREKKLAAGWVGFYWGKTLEDCKKGKTIGDAIMAGWLETFRARAQPRAKAQPGR